MLDQRPLSTVDRVLCAWLDARKQCESEGIVAREICWNAEQYLWAQVIAKIVDSVEIELNTLRVLRADSDFYGSEPVRLI